MEKKKVFIKKRRIDTICCILCVIYFIAIILDIVAFATYLNLCKSMNVEVSAASVIEYFFQLIAFITAWVITIYVLLTISDNRKIIQDMTVILNEMEITNKGIEKVKKIDNLSFESDEFRDCCKELNEENICECGYQIFEGDSFCPNCGKKIKEKIR